MNNDTLFIDLPEPLRAGPEVAAVTAGRRRMLMTAWIGLLLVAAIGVAGVLLPITNPNLNLLHLAMAVIGAIAISGAAIIYFLSQAASRQIADQALLIEAFHGVLTPQLITDGTGALVVANRAFLNWLDNDEQTPQVGLSNVMQHFAGEPGSTEEMAALAASGSAGQAGVAEIPCRRHGQIVEWRRVVARPLNGWQGYVLWRFEDVTERRLIEEAIREERAKLLDFMDNAPVGIYSVDQQGRFLLVNGTLATWLGTAPEKMLKGLQHFHDVLAEPPPNMPPYALARGADGLVRADVALKTSDGRRLPVAITQTLVTSDDGATVRTRSVVRDLTPERTWQEALSKSEQRFARLFAEAPVGIALLDQQLRVTECNTSLLRLFDADKKHLLGQSFPALLAPANKASTTQRLQEVLQGQDLTKPLDLMLPLGGRELTTQIFARRLGLDGENGLLLHVIDITEQKNLESKFVQSQKMQAIGQLAGGIAHDFNNLLTAMIGFADLLLLRHKPSDQSFNDIMQIKNNASRAASLVRQLLAFSRQQTLQPKVLNITDVLAELAHLLRRLLGANTVLDIIHGRDLWLIKADQVQLEQVIINLAVNARDAMGQNGALFITTSNHTQKQMQLLGQDEMPAGEYVVVSVRDNGSGIPAHILPRIFEPFFTTKPVGQGTGLGLSMVYGIVRQTGGFIAVESAPNAGTTFSIYLPRHDKLIAPATATDPEQEQKAADLTGTGTILLVEDEDAVRIFSARALRNKGYEVFEARGGEEALQILTTHGSKIDLLVSDVVMPHMDGPTLVAKVRQTFPRLKVIFISGYTEDKFRDQLKAGEVVHFLGKPFNLKQLAMKVKEVLEGGSA